MKNKILADKMRKIADGLEKGEIPILSEVANEFMEALNLFELAREAKKKSKSLNRDLDGFN